MQSVFSTSRVRQREFFLKTETISLKPSRPASFAVSLSVNSRTMAIPRRSAYSFKQWVCAGMEYPPSACSSVDTRAYRMACGAGAGVGAGMDKAELRMGSPRGRVKYSGGLVGG